MIAIPQDEENEIEEQKLIEQKNRGEILIPQHKLLIKSFCLAIIMIILISSWYFKRNNSLDSIEKIKENINVNKTNLSIIINSFNEKNDLISLFNKILTKKIEYSEIILTTNYFVNYSKLKDQEKECEQKNISTKYIEYKKNTNTVKMRLDSASRANSDYLIFIDPEELLSFDILDGYIKIIKDNPDIDIIQYDLDFDRIENKKIIYQPQIFESLFYSRDSLAYNHFHINGKIFKRELFVNANNNLKALYLEQSDKYYDEIMIISLVFKQANTFIKLKKQTSCNSGKCQKNLFRSYKYDAKILKDTILFVRFLFEYTGEDKVQEKRMATQVFNELLISKGIKYFYNNELFILINDTIDLYVNCDLINDMDKKQIINYRKGIRK